MAKFYQELTPELQSFIAQQKVFFTATAPAAGRINLSPKGMNTFRCLDAHTVAYLDLTGSGNETAAHLQQDDRITVMFCSFDEKPLILRLYGRGKMVFPRDDAWSAIAPHFELFPGTRQIVTVQVESAQTSCGYGVPVCDEMRDRDTLYQWAEKKGEDGIREYWQTRNLVSIDGLPTNLLAD